MIRVLLVDDSDLDQRTARMILEGGHTVLSAYTGAEGAAMARAQDPDVVLLDLRLPDRNGLQVLEEILALPVPPPVVMYTAFGDIPLAVRAIKAGAYDFVEKKGDLSLLTETIRRAALARTGLRSPAVEHGGEAIAAILGASPAIERVRSLVARFGGSRHAVLIRGESGAGKELVASALHAVSGRKGPFLAVNCGTLPETLVESELFGTERGAFTDAGSRAGVFEKAEGGSLFLDEVAEMSQSAQAKLLRVLEDKQVTRLGGHGCRYVDVRVISATCRVIGPASRLMRQELYYRLGVLTIEVPPLRERPEDIAILAAAFLRRDGAGTKRLSEGAMERLRGHPWPGNVRELRNVIARAGVLSDGDAVGPETIVFD